MSLCSKLRKGRVAVGLLIALAVPLISSPALAQSDSNPKYDIFVGYQWMHPGATVPTPGNDPNNPIALSSCRIWRREAGLLSLIISIGIGGWNSTLVTNAASNCSTPFMKPQFRRDRALSGAPTLETTFCILW